MAAIGRVLLMDKGAYNGSTVYNQLDWVRDNGAAWVCKVDGTVGITPVEGANWTLMAQDGSVSGAVDWSTGVNNKPFETVDTTTDFEVDANNELQIKRDTFGVVRVKSGATVTDLEASGDSIVQIEAGNNVTISADDTTSPKKLVINSTGGGGGGASKLDDLSDVTITGTPSQGETLIANSSGIFENQPMPQGGHTMLPTPSSSVNESAVVSAINTAITTDGGANDDVPSLFGVGVWSNEKNVTIEVHGDTTTIDATGIGDWKEDSELVNPTAQDESGWGWVYVPELIGMGSNHTVDFKLTFDPVACGGPVTLGGYILDDTTGYLCIKFGNEIASPSTAIIGIEVIYKRNGRRVVGS